MAIEKIKILGALLELPAKPHCQFSPFGPFFEINGLDWQCYLAGSSKKVSRSFTFLIVQGAEYSFYVKTIATYAPTFLGYNNLVLAIVYKEMFVWTKCHYSDIFFNFNFMTVN